ncbi:MAG: hypothetical protein K2W95_14895 [Candidatus Obscuribacterales bacterium]|nr:hypothetical protein [Candidatus Obscuribacterales bacterium]
MGLVKNPLVLRFINERAVIEQLKEVSARRLQALVDHRMFVQPKAEVLQELSLLDKPYNLVTGRQSTDPTVIANELFEPEALELITDKCLNSYWLWYLLDKLQPAAFALSEAALARAHARAKDSLYDNRHGFAFVCSNSLEHQLKQFPPGFVLELWHKGRILAHRTDSGEYPVRLNPLLIED